MRFTSILFNAVNQQILNCMGGGEVFGSIFGPMLPKVCPKETPGAGRVSSSFGEDIKKLFLP